MHEEGSDSNSPTDGDHYVGRARVERAAFDAAARHPGREGVRVVVAAPFAQWAGGRRLGLESATLAANATARHD